jgi:hypothetical protein
LGYGPWYDRRSAEKKITTVGSIIDGFGSAWEAQGQRSAKNAQPGRTKRGICGALVLRRLLHVELLTSTTPQIGAQQRGCNELCAWDRGRPDSPAWSAGPCPDRLDSSRRNGGGTWRLCQASPSRRPRARCSYGLASELCAALGREQLGQIVSRGSEVALDRA